jgi:caffeoyl-CoA O-methyltransferase
MAFALEQVSDYILAMTRHHDPLLAEMEQRAEAEGFPIIGPHVGPWLYTLTRLIGATRVYELGSGYGYSTWYFCKAVQENSGGAGTSARGDAADKSVHPTEEAGRSAGPTVVHTVWDAQLSSDARANLTRAGFAEFTTFIEGEAVAALTAADGGWDIIFMDIDKEGYAAALPVIEQKLRPGGLLLVDNLIWSGKVADATDTRSSTEGIRRLTTMLRDSPRWELLILPLRDGLGVARFVG